MQGMVRNSSLALLQISEKRKDLVRGALSCLVQVAGLSHCQVERKLGCEIGGVLYDYMDGKACEGQRK